MSVQIDTAAATSALVPTGRSPNYIDGLATRLAQKLGFKSGGELRTVVTRLGGRVHVRDWREPLYGQVPVIEVHGPGDFTISVSPAISEFRERFQIAHDLGHYFLHSLIGERPLRVMAEDRELADAEADWFAMGFLLPRDELLEKAAELRAPGDAHRYLIRLADHFGLPSDFIKHRLEALGYGV